MPQSVILFYQYQELGWGGEPFSPSSLSLSWCKKAAVEDDEHSDCQRSMEDWKTAIQGLCQALQLKGRVLLSAKEGINGTLASSGESNVQAFCQALSSDVTAEDEYRTVEYRNDESRKDESVEISSPLQQQKAIQNWRTFLQKQPLQHRLRIPLDEFKWSRLPHETNDLFPDLNVKIQRELISTGGVLADIPTSATGDGYLSPQEWHQELLQYKQQMSSSLSSDKNDMVWIDCRNDKEFQLGHFDNAINPQTQSFAQFPHWVRQHAAELAHKQVRMYCTGGIRCEKASAYIRSVVPTVKNVHHLQGGIHRYLEAYPSTIESTTAVDSSMDVAATKETPLWKGKNFVFDGRSYESTAEQDDFPDKTNVVGRCRVCDAPFDRAMDCVCTVCREPVLVCDDCRQWSTTREYHCSFHTELRTCYFTHLKRFTLDELQQQYQELSGLLRNYEVGKQYKQKRGTLRKQMSKIQQHLRHFSEESDGAETLTKDDALKCRNCGDVQCTGKCWGFYSLKRKERLEQQQREQANQQQQKQRPNNDAGRDLLLPISSSSANFPKKARTKNIHENPPSLPPSAFRNSTTGIRVPATSLRVLSCQIKRKWKGRSALEVVKEQWNPTNLSDLLQRGLIKLNGTEAVYNSERLLQVRDTSLSRLIHWHEAPIHLPSSEIAVQKVILPGAMVKKFALQDPMLLVCHKPASVPVHPAGPYQSNSLTHLIKGQLDLPDDSRVHPLHRIDRVTSGLSLCSTDSSHARWFHWCQQEGTTRKLYLAKVHGKWDSNLLAQQYDLCRGDASPTALLVNKSSNDSVLEVEGPIWTADPAQGIRVVDRERGKTATSRFRLLDYDQQDDTSLLLCSPMTGRNHQLRVHLQALGHSILGDIQYGGRTLASCRDNGGHDLDHVCQELRNAPTEKSLPDCVTQEEAVAARSTCAVCADPITAFSSAQLLQGGHEIWLHAWKYQMWIPSTRRTGEAEITREGGDHLTSLDLSVSLPSWVSSTQIDEGNVEWL